MTLKKLIARGILLAPVVLFLLWLACACGAHEKRAQLVALNA